MFSAIVSLVGFLDAQEEKDQKVYQTTCPVMGGDIDKDVFVDFGGKRIYFCCKGCPDKFLENHTQYMKKMAKQGIVLMDAPKLQTTCPVMGGKIDKNVSVDHNGERIYFCCKGCPDQFKKEPAKYLAKLKNEGVTLQRTPKPQVTCPVMGGKIDQKVYVDYQGKRIYFCCKGCPETFQKTPKKYLAKMEKQGITLDPIPVVKKSSTRDEEGATEQIHHEGEGHDSEHHDKDAHGGDEHQHDSHHGKKQQKKGCGGGGCGGHG